jgi:hypothetical protein
VRTLEARVEELRRAAKRQAAPFSRGEPKSKPRRGGRRPGSEYGTKAHRPPPERIDEELVAPVEDRCPCGGEIEHERIAYQYQTELPTPRPIERRIAVHIGRCRRCRRRHQGRHPLQTSDALGAAAAQLGPRAVAQATQLNKELGLSPQKTAAALFEIGGISVTPGGIVQAIARTARTLEPTYGALVEGVRRSPVVAADETGWRVQALRQWLWVFVGTEITVYLIAAGRGYKQACAVLGADYAGVLERDGWAPYRRFEGARHQSCVAHLLRRASEMIADSIAGQARIPHAVRRLLLDALAVRERFTKPLADGPGGEVIEGTAVELDPEGRPSEPSSAPRALPARTCAEAATETGVSANLEADAPDRTGAEAGSGEQSEPHPPAEGERSEGEKELRAARSELEARLDQLLARNPTHAPNRRLLAHLRNERDHLLTFLETPGVEATNWRAEQAIRPAVVNRKSWGGNRSWAGAHTQEVVMSVIRTARQQRVDPIELIVATSTKPEPAVSEALAILGRRSRASPLAALAA